MFLPQSVYAAASDVNVKPEINQSFYFLSLADIHFDPFVACKQQPCPLIEGLRKAPISQWSHLFSSAENAPSTYGQDSNFTLLRSSLNAAAVAANLNHAQFVLVLGDFLGHDYRQKYKRFSRDKSYMGYQDFVRKTYDFLSNEIASTFPQKDVYALVGNNDSYHQDYYIASNSKFFIDGVHYWGRLIKHADNRRRLQQSFPTGGYYSVNVPNSNLRLIIVNSVLFSNLARGKNISDAAAKQLSWLQQELADTVRKKQKAIIAMHIPMGVDLFAGFLFRLIDLWEPDYTKQFEDLLKIYSSNIAGVFAGHLHSGWSQILKFKGLGKDIPTTGTPSISPIFGNNPAFKSYFYDGSAKIEEHKTYVNLMNRTGWNLPRS